MLKHYGLLGLVLLPGIMVNGCERADSQEENPSGQQQQLVSGAGLATISISSDWGAGYCADITVANQGTSSITGWTVGVNIPNAKVGNLWNGQYTSNGSQITVKSLS